MGNVRDFFADKFSFLGETVISQKTPDSESDEEGLKLTEAFLRNA